jgi:NADH-quinone oxidoreductase subunit L
MPMTEYLWLIPALPLVAAGLSALLPQSQRTAGAARAIGSLGGAFLLSCVAFVATWKGHGDSARAVHNFDWFTLGETTFQLGWV